MERTSPEMNILLKIAGVIVISILICILFKSDIVEGMPRRRQHHTFDDAGYNEGDAVVVKWECGNELAGLGVNQKNRKPGWTLSECREHCKSRNFKFTSFGMLGEKSWDNYRAKNKGRCGCSTHRECKSSKNGHLRPRTTDKYNLYDNDCITPDNNTPGRCNVCKIGYTKFRTGREVTKPDICMQVLKCDNGTPHNLNTNKAGENNWFLWSSVRNFPFYYCETCKDGYKLQQFGVERKCIPEGSPTPADNLKNLKKYKLAEKLQTMREDVKKYQKRGYRKYFGKFNPIKYKNEEEKKLIIAQLLLNSIDEIEFPEYFEIDAGGGETAKSKENLGVDEKGVPTGGTNVCKLGTQTGQSNNSSGNWFDDPKLTTDKWKITAQRFSIGTRSFEKGYRGGINVVDYGLDVLDYKGVISNVDNLGLRKGTTIYDWREINPKKPYLHGGSGNADLIWPYSGGIQTASGKSEQKNYVCTFEDLALLNISVWKRAILPRLLIWDRVKEWREAKGFNTPKNKLDKMYENIGDPTMIERFLGKEINGGKGWGEDFNNINQGGISRAFSVSATDIFEILIGDANMKNNGVEKGILVGGIPLNYNNKLNRFIRLIYHQVKIVKEPWGSSGGVGWKNTCIAGHPNPYVKGCSNTITADRACVNILSDENINIVSSKSKYNKDPCPKYGWCICTDKFPLSNKKFKDILTSDKENELAKYLSYDLINMKNKIFIKKKSLFNSKVAKLLRNTGFWNSAVNACLKKIEENKDKGANINPAKEINECSLNLGNPTYNEFIRPGIPILNDGSISRLTANKTIRDDSYKHLEVEKYAPSYNHDSLPNKWTQSAKDAIRNKPYESWKGLWNDIKDRSLTELSVASMKELDSLKLNRGLYAGEAN